MEKLDLSRSYFDSLGFAVGFEIDATEVAQRCLELQRAYHPDRHVSSSDAQRRYAEQCSAYINQAKATLVSPLKRGIYLLQQQGLVDGEESLRVTDTLFLMEQMELRERLADAEDADDPFAELDLLRSEAEQLHGEWLAAVAGAFASDDGNAAVEMLAKLQFVDKLLREIELLEERLDD